ncbi:MAG: family 10 glycosylhydrolase, partial [Planctomycetota bacterium]
GGKEVGEQNPFVWLNPLHPEAQQLLLDIVSEAALKYDLDGVQLDDRIAMPVEMGYDDYTKQLYASEHDGAMPPADMRDPAWVQWRADKVTAYAKRFASELKARHPDLIVSVSPAPYPWSLDNYACDWPQWLTWTTGDGRPLWDEAIPQCYRTSFDAFETNWQQQVEAVEKLGDGRTSDLIAGVRVVGAGADTPWPDVARKLDLSDDFGGGYCIWFSRAVLDVYPDEFTEHMQP